MPSMPTTIRSTGVNFLPEVCLGTTTTGHLACAGRAEDTVPSSRSAKPPEPLDPTTTRSASLEKSMRTPAGSPGWMDPPAFFAPCFVAWATASSTTCCAPFCSASSSSTAYPPSRAAAE